MKKQAKVTVLKTKDKRNTLDMNRDYVVANDGSIHRKVPKEKLSKKERLRKRNGDR